jgi:hypothetical protein
MRKSRVLLLSLVPAVSVLFAACSQAPSSASSTMPAADGNPISGVGLPNPAPVVMANWGSLPAGREWGSTAGIDIDPIDGHIWAYERF